METPLSGRGRPVRGRGRVRGGGRGVGRPGAARGAHLAHPQEQVREEKRDGPKYVLPDLYTLLLDI